MDCQETLTEFTPGSAETLETGSGQTTTDADGLGLGLTLGLGVTLGLGLADGLSLGLGDGLSDAVPLADGLALLLGSGDDAVADGDAEFETCGDGSVVVVGSSVPVRAVIVSDVDASGDASSAVSIVADGDELTDEEADALGDVDTDGELLDDGEALGDVDADGDADALASSCVKSSAASAPDSCGVDSIDSSG